MMTRLFVDADGCPVKDEVYRVATRYKLHVFVVANQYLNVPLDPLVEMQVVTGGCDAADDWIVENSRSGDIVVTSDILLAARLIPKNVGALGPKGAEWTEDNMGDAVANRELMQNLRHMGEKRGGPAPMDKKDRSRFLGTLDQMIQKRKRS
jgi:uncharacterized protein YaiI (UPF0178 family)